MKQRSLGGALLLALLLAIPALAQARAVHYFQCADCHRSGSSLYALDGLCLNCHEYPAAPISLNDNQSATPSGVFVKDDASNAMGTHPNYNAANAMETSHMWAVLSETNPAAGAQSPTLYASRFDGRYNISRGKVICNRCHNPHGVGTYDKKILKLNNSRDQMCRDCHLPWTTSDPNAFESHPLVDDYNSVVNLPANLGKFQTLYNSTTGGMDTNVGNGDVRLLYNSLSGKYMVSCTSCHGVHFTDSDAATVDGKTNYNSLAVGDGKLLRSDGYRDPGGLTTAQLAQKRSNLCQACHNYQAHGQARNVGCLDCHSGHSYNGGNPNYFVLRGRTTNPGNGQLVTALVYNTVIAPWEDGKGVAMAPDNTFGYCERCHGNVTDPGFSPVRTDHKEGEDCRGCHVHNKTGIGYSFEGNCNTCHGFPPSENVAGGVPNSGWAVDTPKGYDYQTSGSWKNEATTPHSSHAGPASGYNIACSMCHSTYPTTHDQGTYQSVLEGGTAAVDDLADAGGSLASTYATGAPGTCSAIYCHGNGGRRTGDNPTTATRAYRTQSVTWDGAKGSIIGKTTPTHECAFCHGNTVATMGAADKDNTSNHVQHLNNGYACDVCHSQTAASATALAAGAAGGKHVDGTVEVFYNSAYVLGGTNTLGSGSYDGATGICAVYCHSNGIANVKTADWDSTPTDACYACHDHDASSAAMDTGSHKTHVDDADNEVGRSLGCADCHRNTVSDNITISAPSKHIDGAKTLGIAADGNKTSCTNIRCHSNGNFDGTLVYYNSATDFIWGSTILGCDGCHGDGAGNAYPSYNSVGVGGDANSHAAHVGGGIACDKCHSGTATGNALKTGGTPLHVNQVVDVAGAQFTSYNSATNTCSNVTCHGGNSPVWGDTALSCANCHLGTGDTDDFVYNNATTAKVDSAEWSYSGHGRTTGTYDVTNYNAANLSGGVSAAGDACRYCHDGGVAHGDANFFRLRTNAAQGFTDLNGNCIGCHATGSAGVDPDGVGTDYNSVNASVKVEKYHGGVKHSATTDGGRWCWDCHDPHGDAAAANQRIEMIQRRAAVNPNYNSVPNSLTGTDILFYDRTVGAGIGGFARDAVWTVGRGEGICNACHTGTTQYTPTLGKASHSTDTCTSCHEHSKAPAGYDGDAFKGSACNGCHGAADGRYWPDGTPPGNPTYDYADNSAGAHDKHVLAISQGIHGLDIAGLLADAATDLKQKEICAFCHNAPGGSGHSTDSGNSRVDVYQDSGVGDYFRKWAPGGYSDDVDASEQAYNYTNATCSNLACHNREATPANWNAPPASPTCAVCHAANGSSAGRHDTHVGKGYSCTECHVNSGNYPGGITGLDHADGDVDLLFNSVGSFEQSFGGGSITYNGLLIYADNDFGSCAGAACHADTQTPPFNALPASPNNCGVCHSDTPTTGAHTTHLNAVYGPSLVNDCGACHDANHNNTDMSGYATHVDGSVTFNSATLLGTATSCDACHGGATPAGTAKTNWPTAVRVSCESCHGDYAEAVVGGKVALHNAGTGPGEYYASGHGKSGVTQSCAACHDQNAAGHIDGVVGDDKRMKTIGAYTYGTRYNSASISYCASACHANTMTLHYTNGAAGTSFPADGAMDCLTCHNPHGQNLDAASSALDTMIRPVIDGKEIVAFYNTAVRADYYVGTPNSGGNNQYGICQACHDKTDSTAADGTLLHFNRTDVANTSHYSGVCTSCHKHDDATVAFKPSGCNGCHGDATNGNFWPDTAGSSSVNYPDRAGLHVQHVDAIGDQINGGGAGSATLDDKNASCVYCHPDPGGTNVNGAGHDIDTTGSPAKITDLHKDGWNPATSYLNMQSGSDPEGLYRPTIKRCSAVDCHSSGEFTWTWYPDVLAPNQVTDLFYNSAVPSDPGTVVLEWSAPANDGTQGPNAYHNEVRYSTSAITTGALYNSATIAGGPPSVIRRGKKQQMTVTGLAPAQTYHFAVKVADEEYNWSSASNSVSAIARADNQAPVFWGINSATAADEPGTVMLAWDAATDNSLPVTYSIWYNSAIINYAAPPQATTQGTNYRVTGLPGGVLYNFAVRASDAVTPTPNSDSNTLVVQQLAKTPPVLAKSFAAYYTNGTTALQTTSPGTAGSGALGVNATRTWTYPTPYDVDTNVVGTSFSLRVQDSSEQVNQQITAYLGYMTGGAWNDFVPAVSVVKDIGAYSNRIQTFNFGGGGKVPAGSQLAVRVKNTGNNSLNVSHGSATNRGDLYVTEQLFNHLPTGHSFSPQPNGSGIVTISWTVATDQDGHAIHYDVYGSDDGGLSYDYLIARNLPAATTSVQWDTVTAGIGLTAANNQVKVKVLAGDGYQSGDGSGDHTATESPAWTVDNTVDTIAPAAITDLIAETRPKMGSIYLHWHAPGDDDDGKAPAAQYDIRWNIAAIANDTEFDSATTVSAEPVPGFGGTPQGYEVLGLTPGIHYYFAIKTADEQGNWSALSNTAEANGGLKCGICHGTPPDDSATAGNHIAHGYTINDCAKCHGPVGNYNTTSHQDGKLVFGFGRDAAGNRLAAVEATIGGANNEIVTYWQDPDGVGPQPPVKIYEDTNGGGGFNETAWAGSDKVDSGACFGFTSVNASGCHGPATPSWDENASLVCADCHGDHGRVNDLYDRPYDDTGEDIQASPPTDNHGNQGLPTDPIQERRYVGQHEKHLNSSFRFAKGDSCRMCHKDNNHADGAVDFAYDYAGAGEGALWTPYNTTTDTPGSCAGTSDLSCHGVNVTPKWDSAENVECNTCHGFGGVAPDHVTDPNGAGFVDDGKGNCEWCHPAGHPREGVLANMVLIPNNPFVGITYASGGIHLKTDIAGRGPFATEAEMCWGCHDSNGISEWGTNTKAETGSSPYDYGALQGGVSNWVGATWLSGTAAFGYKNGAIQSTHSTSPAGSSAVTFVTGNGVPDDPDEKNHYKETPDAVALIRCTNCHDVHNRNLADGDTMTGTPYLRGTWKGNPYKEDGAPQAGTVYTAYTVPSTIGVAPPQVGFGAIPRGGTQYVQEGGYYIDQNSSYPTAGWSLEISAGLCTLCHGADVDVLDQKTTGENLWFGTNGHSNAVLGGTGVSAANIFDYTHGRPAPVTPLGENLGTGRVGDMAFQAGGKGAAAEAYYPLGYRGAYTLLPRTNGARAEEYDFNAYDWGATVDNDTTDYNFHQFSCSKCHNPHASRLPKLMITNCLDIRQNTWDDAKNTQNKHSASTTDYGKTIAYWVSAQNCHRRDSSRNPANFDDPINGGWNKVTPW